MKTYPINSTGLRYLPSGHINPGPDMAVRAVLTGEFRAPKAGEWFLSGAIPEAYHCTKDFTVEYHIVELVMCQRTWEAVG